MACCTPLKVLWGGFLSNHARAGVNLVSRCLEKLLLPGSFPGWIHEHYISLPGDSSVPPGTQSIVTLQTGDKTSTL